MQRHGNRRSCWPAWCKARRQRTSNSIKRRCSGGGWSTSIAGSATPGRHWSPACTARSCRARPPAATRRSCAGSSPTARRACRASSTCSMRSRSQPSPRISAVLPPGHQVVNRAAEVVRSQDQERYSGERHDKRTPFRQRQPGCTSQSRSERDPCSLPALADAPLSGAITSATRRTNGRRDRVGQGRRLHHHHQRLHRRVRATTTSRRCRKETTGSGRRRCSSRPRAATSRSASRGSRTSRCKPITDREAWIRQLAGRRIPGGAARRHAGRLPHEDAGAQELHRLPQRELRAAAPLRRGRLVQGPRPDEAGERVTASIRARTSG